jgi:hypothetical protein
MHKTINKHGPDTDVGIRRTLARAAEVTAGKHPPWMEIRYGPPSLVPRPTSLVPQMERWRSGIGYSGLPSHVPRPSSLFQEERQRLLRATVPRPSSLVPQKERRWRPRDFVTLRRTGESPPGIVKELTMNNIDSTVRSKLPARGRLNHGVFKDIYCLTANFMPERMEKKPRKDAETQRYAMIGFLDRMVSSRLLSGSLNHRGKLLEMGRKLTGSCRPSFPFASLVPRPPSLVPRPSSLVPRPPSLVPLQTTINLIST